MTRSAAQVICKGCGSEMHRGPRSLYCSDQCQRAEYQKDWYQNNRTYYRERYLKKTYNLTLADVETLRATQDNKCAICRVDLNNVTDKNTHIDHCHETGIVRGILCINCNTGLGSFNDDVSLLHAAARYLND